jgi:hypothetical protein
MSEKRDDILWDEELGVVIETTHWFPGMLDHIAHLRNTYARAGKPQDFRLLAHIDGWVIEEWCKKNRYTFDQFTRDPKVRAEMLNDPDMSAFRIWRGKV